MGVVGKLSPQEKQSHKKMSQAGDLGKEEQEVTHH
jgi:hypothetical protein